MKIIKKSVFIFCAVFSFFLFGCNSIKQPESIVQPVDYTNEDVVKNEIGNIQRLMEKESTKALFRAYLLQNQQIFNECAALVQKQAENAVEEKDFVHALCLYKSLVSVDYNTQENLSKYNDYYQNIYDDVPGFSLEQSKSPSSIKDCINATVTIWVDNGLKVENGAGYADIVIGSGFFIDKRGYIITNNHVIEAVVNPKNKAAAKLFIKLPSDTETKIPAKVVGYDSIMDLALLKAEIEPEYVLELGSSSDLEVGDRISAIGTPIGLEGTLTSGIISSTERKLLTLGNVFQIDAAAVEDARHLALLELGNLGYLFVLVSLHVAEEDDGALPLAELVKSLLHSVLELVLLKLVIHLVGHKTLQLLVMSQLAAMLVNKVAVQCAYQPAFGFLASHLGVVHPEGDERLLYGILGLVSVVRVAHRVEV